MDPQLHIHYLKRSVVRCGWVGDWISKECLPAKSVPFRLVKGAMTCTPFYAWHELLHEPSSHNGSSPCTPCLLHAALHMPLSAWRALAVTLVVTDDVHPL